MKVFFAVVCSLLLLPFFALSGCNLVEAPEIRKAKTEVADALRDPASAQFRNVESFGLDSGSMVCGEVNGKNGFGAYTGFTHFMYREPLFRIADNPAQDLAIARCCRTLKEQGTRGEARWTSEIPGCTAVEPNLVM